MSIENSIYFQFLISVPYILPFQIPIDEINVKLKSSTLTREADPPPPGPAVAVPIKPQVPAKPAHIRPGLKPVKIPTVDDKVWVHFKINTWPFYFIIFFFILAKWNFNCS